MILRLCLVRSRRYIVFRDAAARGHHHHTGLKSDNLQYNTLVRWADGTNDSSTKRLMFQVLFFFIKSCKILCKNPFNLFFLFFYKITKMKIKSFECPKSIRNYEKKYRRLVDELFVPSAQGSSVLYCRLSDFTTSPRVLIYK